MTSWDDKGPVKIQKALEIEFDSFISGVKDVSNRMVMENILSVCCCEIGLQKVRVNVFRLVHVKLHMLLYLTYHTIAVS